MILKLMILNKIQMMNMILLCNPTTKIKKIIIKKIINREEREQRGERKGRKEIVQLFQNIIQHQKELEDGLMMNMIDSLRHQNYMVKIGNRLKNMQELVVIHN